MNVTGATDLTRGTAELTDLAASCERVFGVDDVADAGGQVPADPHLAIQRLAAALAAHLITLRRQGHGGTGSGVTTFAQEPAPVPGMVTIGHLVAVSMPLAELLDLPHAGQECVIWEQLPTRDVPAWLGAALPEPGPPSPQRLLQLKRAVREQALPDSAAGRALGELLASGRYLSARLAYQYPDLLLLTLNDLDLPAIADPAAPTPAPDPHLHDHHTGLLTGASMSDTSTNTWTTGTRTDLAASYARHIGSLRGAVRQALVSRALLQHLGDDRPQRILDVGAGTGQQGIALARAGHDVVLLDPDPAMLQAARAAVEREAPPVQVRITFVHGDAERAVELAGDGFDLVSCHGVLMYVPDPAPLIGALVDAVRVGGLISVLAKNADALAMRPGIEGRWSDALDVLDRQEETGRLGVSSRGDSVGDLIAVLDENSALMVAWYGVRIFTDHLRDTPVGADFDQICDLEWAAGTCDPYRQVARLLHLVARRKQS